jgi:hypothetical protein
MVCLLVGWLFGFVNLTLFEGLNPNIKLKRTVYFTHILNESILEKLQMQ